MRLRLKQLGCLAAATPPEVSASRCRSHGSTSSPGL